MLMLIPAGIAACGLVAVLYQFNPARFGFYPVCLFHATTGLLCPGCGSLRSMHQMLHGNLGTALHCNLLLVLSVPVIAGLVIRYAWLRWQQRPTTFLIRPSWIWAAAAAVFLFSILRNLPLEQFSWMRP